MSIILQKFTQALDLQCKLNNFKGRLLLPAKYWEVTVENRDFC